MNREFTLEFWQDEGWFVGQLREIPGVFSQGETMDELEKNIADAYQLMFEERGQADHPPSQEKSIVLKVA
jgi:predicted RNase H-like HicB family nuclease